MEFLKKITKIEFEYEKLPETVKIAQNFEIRRPEYRDAEYRDERFGIFGYSEKPLKMPQNNPEKDAITFVVTAENLTENPYLGNLFFSLNANNVNNGYQYDTRYSVHSGSMLVNTFIASNEFADKTEIFAKHSSVYPEMVSHPLGIFRSRFYGVQEPALDLESFFKKSGDWMYSQVKMGEATTQWDTFNNQITLNPTKLQDTKKVVLDFSDVADKIKDKEGVKRSLPTLVVENFFQKKFEKITIFAVKSTGEKVEIPTYKNINWEESLKINNVPLLAILRYNGEKLLDIWVRATEMEYHDDFVKYEIIFE